MTFSPDAVAARRHAADWKDAIRLAGELYEQSGIATAKYTEAMIAAVEEFGPYIVLIPGVAMPHAATSDGVKTDGSVVVTLADPVKFGSTANDPVDVLISFAAGDPERHMARIKSLASALSNADLVAAIRNAHTDEELRQVFNSGTSSHFLEGTIK